MKPAAKHVARARGPLRTTARSLIAIAVQQGEVAEPQSRVEWDNVCHAFELDLIDAVAAEAKAERRRIDRNRRIQSTKESRVI